MAGETSTATTSAAAGRTPELVELLEAGVVAGSGRGVTFDDGTKLTWRDLWDAAAKVRPFAAAHHAVGVIAQNDPATIALILGAWRAGGRVVSLPAPARGMNLDEYRRGLAGAVAASGVTVIVCASDGAVALLEPISPVPVVPAAAAAAAGAGSDGDGAELVQFTSGSTAFPRGVLLDGRHVAANVAAICDTFSFDAGTGGLSWLPLSHDMGLLGGLLASMAAGYDLRLSDPGRFIRNPASWLDDVTAHRPGAAVLPNFALKLIGRHLAAAGNVDLSSLRYCILGGDPVSAPALRHFTDAASGVGLRPDALRPAYGMAEASLAVTLTAGLWRSVIADADAYKAGELAIVGVADARTPPAVAGVEVATSGAPAPGMTVTGAEPAGPASILTVDGPSMMRGYVGGAERTAPHVTADLGWVAEGDVIVAGRADDVIVLRARKLHPCDIEPAVEQVRGVRAGNVAAVTDLDDIGAGYVIVAEVARDVTGDERLCRLVRAAASKAVGAAPTQVLLVAAGTLPKTTSGKLRRAAVASRVAAGTLPAVAAWRR